MVDNFLKYHGFTNIIQACFIWIIFKVQLGNEMFKLQLIFIITQSTGSDRLENTPFNSGISLHVFQNDVFPCLSNAETLSQPLNA